MIIRNNGYETNSLYLNTDWYNEGNYVVDETNTENQELINKIKEHSPYMELVIENDIVVDIIPIEKSVQLELPKEPTTEDYLIDLDFRVSKIELGLEI